MGSKILWITTVLFLFVLGLEARMLNWNSNSLSGFGPDFERQWAFGEGRVGSDERPIKSSARIPSQLADEKGVGGKNRKNCFMSPVQCSFYFKRSMDEKSTVPFYRSVRSARYI